MFPFKKVTKMSNEDKAVFKVFLDRENQEIITLDDVKAILQIYSNTFNKKIVPCDTCGAVYQSIIKQLTKLYNYD
jgi:hypothetical protein